MHHNGVNGTLMILSDNLTEIITAMLKHQGGRPATPRETGPPEVIYVVVVIVFYALALMMLIGLQMRKTKRHGLMDENYFEEYLKRKDIEEKRQNKVNVMKMTGMKEPCLLEQIPEHDV